MFCPLFASICLESAHAGLAQPISSYDQIETYPVTDGVYVARRPEIVRGSIVTLIINDRDVFVVDGSYTAGEIRRPYPDSGRSSLARKIGEFTQLRRDLERVRGIENPRARDTPGA